MNILDLSEQWLLDCKPKGAKGCKGAGITSYNKYLAEKGKVMHESKHKYKGFCPRSLTFPRQARRKVLKVGGAIALEPAKYWGG